MERFYELNDEQLDRIHQFAERNIESLEDEAHLIEMDINRIVDRETVFDLIDQSSIAWGVVNEIKSNKRKRAQIAAIPEKADSLRVASGVVCRKSAVLAEEIEQLRRDFLDAPFPGENNG